MWKPGQRLMLGRSNSGPHAPGDQGAAQAPGARESAVETMKCILEADVQYCKPFQLEEWAAIPCSGTATVLQSNLGSPMSPGLNNLVLYQVAGRAVRVRDVSVVEQNFCSQPDNPFLLIH